MTLLSPAGKVFAGVTGGQSTDQFAAQTSARPVVYNQGVRSAGPFRLRHYPRSTRVIRHALASTLFSALPAELL